MKLSEFAKIINGLSEGGREDYSVCILLDDPSMGARSTTLVRELSAGIDWENNTILIKAADRITKKNKPQEAYDDAHDLLFWLATKPLKKETYEVRAAKRALKHLGYTEDDFIKVRPIFHRESK